MTERFLSARPHGPNEPPFSLINSHLFGSARSGPGREAAKRTLDGEDRSEIIQGEGKGDRWNGETFPQRLHWPGPGAPPGAG